MSLISQRIVWWLVPVGLLLAVARPSAGVGFPEAEPNSVKPDANPAFNMQPGDFLTGITTGNVTGLGNGAPNTADYFLVQTAPRPLGIYRYQLFINSATLGQLGTIRGLTQTGGVINPGTDAAVQTSSTGTRINQWYGFGRGERIFYRVEGLPTTNQPYNSTLNMQPINPTVIGPFMEGQITITTVGQGHATDTDVWVYDSNFNPIAGFGNDDEPNPGLTTQSLLTRHYAPGTYYLALTNFNFANDQASPPDDRFQNGNVMDFPGSAVNSSGGTNQVVNFAVIDGAGNHPFPATKVNAYDILWYCFGVQSVIPPGEDCWTTECGGTEYDFKNTPIPCSFFDPGSEPFDGVVRLGGGDPGDIDTRVRRNNSMSFGSSLPDTQMVPIEIVALNLVSCAPITVRYCNGQPDETWNVSVGLSVAPPPPPGQMTVTKTHANGGTFDSQFFVQPLFTFTRVSDSAVRVLDTGTAIPPIPPMFLDSTNPAPWVHNATIPIGPQICGVNFVPGVQEANVPATPGSTCVSTVQCCKPVGHAGGGHIHVTGHICTPCPCGACCDPLNGACTEISSVDPAADCAALGGIFKGVSSSCTSADGDSIPDSYETGNCCSTGNCGTGSLCSSPTDPSRADTDGDGLNDDVDPSPCNRCLPLWAPLRPPICDQFDLTLPGDGDCDNDGICDLCEIQMGLSHDCNRNGVPDECGPDCNGNGLPDDYDTTCGTLRFGDMNCDGVVDLLDIDPFVLALLDPAGYMVLYPACNIDNADVRCDGNENGLDIGPFVGCVMTGTCP